VQIVRLSPGGSIAIASGSVGTAAVIQRSVIGPPGILSAANVPVLVPNEEVGHGVDHLEISVQYAWKEANGPLPNGGAMGWPPCGLRQHRGGSGPIDVFGKQTGEKLLLSGALWSWTSRAKYTFGGDDSCVLSTGLKAGFRAGIVSQDPKESMLVVQRRPNQRCLLSVC
jgi:hypothetical protein